MHLYLEENERLWAGRGKVGFIHALTETDCTDFKCWHFTTLPHNCSSGAARSAEWGLPFMHRVKAGSKDKQRKAWLLPSKRDSGMFGVRICFHHYSWIWVLHNWPYAILLHVIPTTFLATLVLSSFLYSILAEYIGLYMDLSCPALLFSSCPAIKQKCFISSSYRSPRISCEQIINLVCVCGFVVSWLQ